MSMSSNGVMNSDASADNESRSGCPRQEQPLSTYNHHPQKPLDRESTETAEKKQSQ